MVKTFLSIFLFFVALNLSAQSSLTDSIFTLPEAKILNSRLENFAFGHRIDTISSAYQTINVQNNLAQTLSQQSSVFIKNYGPGRLATSSIRGASATQTAVIWEGFNLQSPMLGQVDFSLLPNFFIDHISVQHGGSSSLWGSGAIGGAIVLENKMAYDRGWQINWSSNLGSFGNYQNGLSIGFSNKKFSTKTSAFYHSAKNDFTYLNGENREQKLSHSSFYQWGIQQENKFNLQDNQQLSFTSWYQEADREIPPTLFQSTSDAVQKDRYWRNSLAWKFFTQESKLTIRTGLFYEQLEFNSLLNNISGKSHAWTSSSEVDYQYQFDRQHKFNLGANFSYIKAQAKNYLGTPQQNRLAFFLAYQWQNLKNTWKLSSSIRKEFVANKFSPFVPAFAFEGRIYSALFLSGNINASYRLPSFDDLYWSPGGNENLLPENGWSQSLSLRWQKKLYALSLTGFNRNVDNWIIWLPQSAYWSPDNLLEVWSRGLEAKLQTQFTTGHFQWRLEASYDLVFSTNQKEKIKADPSLHKQLIYVPLHKALTNIHVSYQHWNVSLYQNYNGLVYTLADNSESLASYFLQDIHLSRSLVFKKNTLALYAKVKNLWDKNYVVVATQVMPGRHFEVGINFKINNKISN